MKSAYQAALAATAAFVLACVPAAAQAAPEHAEPTAYVALGDSYSSGTGTGQYRDQACRRSDLAYPRLLANGIGAELTHAACSGATSADLLRDQLPALGDDTDLVTLTIGGNDIGWAEAVTACLTPLTDCTDDIAATEHRIDTQLPGLLDGVYGAVADRAPNAEVYVLGYPRLFNGRSVCGALRQPNVGEQRLMNGAADRLADVLADAAQEHGFTYVDVRDAFAGHAVCDDVPYLRGLVYTSTAESYHPNALGHANGYYPAIARAL